jgi:pentatricopeptide repeat protein
MQAHNILDQISYSTLINKAKTFEQAFSIFEEMKSKGLTPNVITFTTLLRKATQNEKSLKVILEILEEMLERKIMPSVEEPRAYTLLAISAKLKKSRQPFKAWAIHQQSKIEHFPPSIRHAWQILFDEFN